MPYLFAGFGVVADVDALHREEHVLGDVGRMVGDALQVLRDEHEGDRAIDGRSEERRRAKVTGVQTCALPIWTSMPFTAKSTSSAMLVEWSAMRSRFCAMNMRETARLMVLRSSCMKLSNSS